MTPKQRSRILIVQALYQWQISGDALSKIEQQFLQQKKRKISKSFFSKLFINIANNISLLNQLIAPTLERSIDKLGYVELSILYLTAYELKFTPEVPYKVVINEAVNIAKIYAAKNAYKLINKSLDNLAKTLRNNNKD